MRYLIFIALALMTTLNAKEYKVVFDCSSSDMNYVKSRMNLIEKSINMIEEQEEIVKVALTLHGGCVPIISTTLHEIAEGSELADIQAAQEKLKYLIHKKKVSVVACAMSLEANAIEQKDVIESVKISKNSFLDTIAYQNNGYAIMTFE